ncbi:efflux RND transporter periplasmic adaptor subunit [Actinoplanes sp. NPDC051470]|uniref:efflux RND transporter periplasmic adaptor subunit n=1 Tax=Actinoplanes sp. NPDC051470 TaxID=3157224 RepID=UPI00344A622E
MPFLSRLRHPSVLVNIALVLLLAGGGYAIYRVLAGPSTAQAAGSSVRAVAAQQGTVTKTVTADGSVAAASTANATFTTGGTVTAISVKVGDRVTKGQRLAKVDPAAAERTLNTARADLDAAEDALDRAQDAGSDTSGAENDVEQARLAVDEAEAGVDGTVLTAPMAGTVVAVNGTLGSAATGSSNSQGGAQQPASTTTTTTTTTDSTGFIDIADLTRLSVTAQFAEADATTLKAKQAATVTWNALDGVQEGAKVAAIDPQATSSSSGTSSGQSEGSSVTYGVTLTLDKVPTGAKPGQTVSVAVVTGEVDDAVFVVSQAVTTAGRRHTVTVLNGAAQEVRPVEIGLEGDSATQITSGLAAGERVVLRETTTTGTQQNGGQFRGGGGLGGLTGGGGPAGGAPGGGIPAGGGQNRGGR